MKSPMFFWVEIICADCARRCYGQFVSGSHIPMKDFMQEVKHRKWIKLDNGEFRCPACDKKINVNAPARGIK